MVITTMEEAELLLAVSWIVGFSFFASKFVNNPG
jgi:hypothetical protein